jgi:hypothetical protein
MIVSADNQEDGYSKKVVEGDMIKNRIAFGNGF